jgi:hypothetical protein
LVYNSATAKWENSSGGYVPYVGAVTTVDLGLQGLEAGFIRLDTSITSPPTGQGTMYWDQDEETVAIILNGSTTKVGEDIFFQVKNQSGATIPKGTAVRFDGVVGASGRINIVPFLADGSNPSIYFLGVTYESIANGADGKALFNGKIRGVNTTAFAVGDILYASPTVAGGFTTTKPVAPNNIISVAAVLSSGANGILLVRPQIGSNINNDEGVKITTPTTGDLLQLQASGLWENKSVDSLSLVPQSRTLTINGTAFDLSVDRSWTIPVHDAVTIGTANGLSLSYQVLSLGLASGSANGALSSTDWTTFNNKIGGTIADGQVAFGTGAGVIGGDSGLFWSDTNKRLGIGTTLPSAKLDIEGDINVSTSIASAQRVATFRNSQLGSSFSAGAFISLGRPDISRTMDVGIYGNGSNKFDGKIIVNETEGSLILGTSQTERMRITSAGNVGIGTTLPSAKLDVSGDAIINGLLIVGRTNSSFESTIREPLMYASSQIISGSLGQGSGDLILQSRPNLPRSILFATNDGTNVSTRWGISSTGIFQSNGAQTIQTSTGDLTIATAGGNGNILLSPNGSGRVGVGTLSPISSAILDLSSTTRGFLPPRMTTTQRDAIASPVAGLMIYNTTTNVINVYNGTIWI